MTEITAKVLVSRADEHFETDEWLGSRSQNYCKIMIVEFNAGGANFIPSGDDFSSQSLQDAVKLSSRVRPEKVAQAKALLSNGNYPSDEDLARLAAFLAGRL